MALKDRRGSRSRPAIDGGFDLEVSARHLVRERADPAHRPGHRTREPERRDERRGGSGSHPPTPRGRWLHGSPPRAGREGLPRAASPQLSPLTRMGNEDVEALPRDRPWSSRSSAPPEATQPGRWTTFPSGIGAAMTRPSGPHQRRLTSSLLVVQRDHEAAERVHVAGGQRVRGDERGGRRGRERPLAQRRRDRRSW
jgi:hypothetical protein